MFVLITFELSRELNYFVAFRVNLSKWYTSQKETMSFFHFKNVGS